MPSRRPNGRQLIAGGVQGAHDRFHLVGPRDADPQRDISDSNPADVATPLDHDSGRRRRAADRCVMYPTRSASRQLDPHPAPAMLLQHRGLSGLSGLSGLEREPF
jgi:hypothetical protein